MIRIGDLVKVWTEDLDFRLRRKYKDNFATVVKLVFAEGDKDVPSFVEVFFPATTTTERFIYSRIRKVEGKNE